jgi:hypothetical protein
MFSAVPSTAMPPATRNRVIMSVEYLSIRYLVIA